MGLLVEFTPEDLGLDQVLTYQVEDIEIEVEVDYSQACRAFVDTFIQVAKDLVPVRTGFLRYTINSETDGFYCMAEATAEYAQYVEYGTWKMEAQPFFEPAFNQAMEEFSYEAQIALEEAYQELQEEVEEAMWELNEDQEEEEFFLEDLLASLAFLIMISPLLMVLDSVSDALTFEQEPSLNIGYLPSIEIT